MEACEQNFSRTACARVMIFESQIVVVVLGFYVPPTAKVIRRRDLGLKSHPKDWRSPGSNSRPLVYKAGSLTARPQRLRITDSVQGVDDLINFW